MRFYSVAALLAGFLSVPGVVAAQDVYKVQELKEAPPPAFAPELASTLLASGYRIVDGEGKPLADFWLRKAIPAAAKPSGSKGVIQFPFLAESELLGVVRLHSEAHDYRNQAIAKGLYTLRYGHQPVNGDHLGVSPFGDYALLLPGAKDKSLAVLPRKQMEKESAESTGSSHPAVLFMLAVPASAGSPIPAMIHDAEKNTWRIVVPLNLSVQGDSQPTAYPVSIIVVGASEAA